MTESIRQREQDPGIVLRIRLLAWIGLGFFALLVVRLYWLQVVHHEHFQNLAENNRLRIRPVRAPRGVILDRKGRPIAETQPSFDLICSPVDVSDLEGEIRLLSEVIEFEPEEVHDRILASQKDNPYSAITVARDLKFEQVSVIEFNREVLHGFAIQVEAKRSYPYGSGFAHVLGYVGEANEQELDARRDEGLVMGDIVGKYGLEGQQDAIIRGINGGRYVEVDAAGRDKRLVTEVPPAAGATIQTALDVDVQKAAMEAMGDKAGAVIAISPKTGDVIAFVSLPAFEPNSFSRGIRKGEWQALLADRMKPMSSKGLQGTYAPGSTVKPFLALAGLEAGVQDPEKPVSCGGSFTYGNKTFRCWKEKGHGPVDMRKALIQSCDVYFYRLGLKIGPDPVAAVERGAGLGTITGIDLPGERKGLVPDSAWKLRERHEKWQDFESILIGIGQGAVHVTPLGMLEGYATIASGGTVMRPRIVTRIVRPDGKLEEKPPVILRKLPWKPENVAFIRKALSGVVNEWGTGAIARLPGIEVGGKTGTAQVAQVKGKMIKSEHLPYFIRDHAWFVAFAPVSDPEIAVVAMVEHGGHGASAAAPVVKAVMQEYFREKLVAPGKEAGR